MYRAPVFAALAAVVVFATPALAQSASSLDGSWEITSQGPRGARTQTFTFRQDGASLTGSTQMRDNTVEIKDGKVDGSTFTFTVTFGMRDRTFSQTYKGTVTGDSMEGTISNPRGETPFKGVRKKM